MTTTKRTNPRGTKAYRALIAANFSDADALGTMADAGMDVSGARFVTDVTPNPTPADPRVTELVKGGFSVEQAERLVAQQDEKPKKKRKGKKVKAEKVVVETVSAKDEGEALVAQRGLAFARGRVYATPQHAEAIVRIHKGGRPEIIPTSGVGRIKAVLVYREDSGDVALQNLTKPV